MPLIFFYTIVQKSQKWPKTQIKGGSCLYNVLNIPKLALAIVDIDSNVLPALCNRLSLFCNPFFCYFFPSLSASWMHLSYMYLVTWENQFFRTRLGCIYFNRIKLNQTITWGACVHDSSSCMCAFCVYVCLGLCVCMCVCGSQWVKEDMNLGICPEEGLKLGEWCTALDIW